MPQAIGAYVANALFISFTASAAAAAAIGVAVTVVATVAINQAASAIFGGGRSSGQGGTTSPQQLAASIRQAAAPRRLIYGTVKAGGLLVYPAQSADGVYADLAIVLGEGPLDGIEPVIYLLDELSSDPKFDGLVEVEFYNGGPGQVASADLIARSGGEWTAADVGTGIAWAQVRLKFTREAFPRGLVLPAFLVRGRLVYDPRSGATAHSSNPPLCALDHLRSEYGPGGGVPDWQIDFPTFATAASICDEIIESIDPANVVNGVAGRVRRYSLNGVFEASANWASVKDTMERAMAGRIVFVNGKYRCFAGAWRAPTGPVLTSEYLRADPAFRTHAGRQQRINVTRGTYREPLQDWQSVDYHEQSMPLAVLAEAGEIVQQIDFPATTNGAQAQRLARLAMNQARSAVPLVLQCNFAAFQWQAFDVLTVSLPEVGASGVYLITEYTYSLSDGGGIDLVLVPQPAEDFAWVPAEQERVVQPVARPSFNSTPQALAGLAVLGVVIYEDNGEFSTQTYGLAATWTATQDAFLKHYETQYKPNAAADFLGGESVTVAAWSRQLSAGVAYDFRVRVVREDGTVGPWATETNILVNGDITPTGPPTALSVTGTTTHTIGWTTPTDLDLMRGKVYASATNDPATGAEIATVFGLPGTAYTTTHTPATVPTHYWVAALDRTGNPSARTFAGVGN